jgi:membrane protease YdiL (CAAX protease family)
MPTQAGTSFSPTLRAPPDPKDPPWGLGGALLVWIASVLLLAIVPLFFLIPYSLLRGFSPSQPDYARNLAELALNDKTGIFLQVLALLPSHLLTFALVWALVTRFGKLPFLAALGWGWPPRLRFWRCVALALGLFAVGTAIAKLLGADKPTQLEQLINSSLAARYTIAVLAVLTAPIVEEFIYRGVLYAALERLIGVAGAVGVVLGLFTLIHVPQYWPNIGVIVAVGLLSVTLTILRAYTGRLLPCIVIHLVFNGVTSIILLVEPHLQRVAPANDQVASVALILTRLTVSLLQL